MHFLFKQSTAALFAVSAFASQAYAENQQQYCEDYANRAVHAGEVARSVRSCLRFVGQTPQHWSLNFIDHYEYCMRVYSSRYRIDQEVIREKELKFCAGK